MAASGAYCARSWCVHPGAPFAAHDGLHDRTLGAGLARLIEAAAERPTACMCAKAPWWRCHRRLVADALVAKRGEVCHIGPDGRVGRHEMTEFALVGEGGRVTYPPLGRGAARA
jgi:hypothetical protein